MATIQDAYPIEKIPLKDRLSVTEQQFAELNGIGVERVRRWTFDPTFPAFKDDNKKGARTVIPVKAAEEWLIKRAKNRENMPRALKSPFSETGELNV